MEQEFSEFSKFRKSLEYELSQLKDPVSQMCLAGSVVASGPLTKEMAGSNPFTVMTNISKYF